MAADIFCLVETQNEESIDYKIPGYYCIYNSNKQPSVKIHGQMCFIKTTILNNIKLVESYKVKSPIKFALQAFLIQFNNLLICTLYKSSSQKNMQTFKTVLKDFLTPYIHRNYQLILLGDFNINLLDNTTISNFLNNDLSLSNALPKNSVTTNKRTFIDWCFTISHSNI
jgi:exonuclease III